MFEGEATLKLVKVSFDEELELLGQKLSRASRLVEHGQELLADGMAVRRPHLGYVLVTDEVDCVLAGGVGILRALHYEMMTVARQIAEERQKAAGGEEG